MYFNFSAFFSLAAMKPIGNITTSVAANSTSGDRAKVDPSRKRNSRSPAKDGEKWSVDEVRNVNALAL